MCCLRIGLTEPTMDVLWSAGLLCDICFSVTQTNPEPTLEATKINASNRADTETD